MSAAPKSFVLPTAPSELKEADFVFFREQLLARTGIALNEVKRDLVQGRLRSRLVELGFSSFADYRAHLEGESVASPEWQAFVNCLTTNKTDFFRESQHFDFVRGRFLNERRARGEKRPLRAWSAACSTGEEPYTLSMVLLNALGPGEAFSVHATDVDTEVLATARAGVYPLDRFACVPEEYSRAFQRGSGDIEGWARISPRVRERVSFGTFNLVTQPLPAGGERFELVFCRNVLIYFQSETIRRVVEKLYDATEPGGYLFIGHSETLNNIQTRWDYVSPATYRRNPKS